MDSARAACGSDEVEYRTSRQRGRPAFFREVMIIVGGFLAYRHARYLTRDDSSHALRNAHRVVDAEQRLHLFSERSVQRMAMNSDVIVSLLDHYYVLVHFPLTAIFLGWLLLRHHDHYRPIRNLLISVSAMALAIHVAFPLAPPRMLAEHGFVDTLARFGPHIYSADTKDSVANQYAAMPSLHFGWAVVVAMGFIAVRQTRSSLVALVHPLVTLFAIVATANHYWLDSIVALTLVCACSAVIWGLPRRRAPRPLIGVDRIHRSHCDGELIEPLDLELHGAVR